MSLSVPVFAPVGSWAIRGADTKTQQTMVRKAKTVFKAFVFFEMKWCMSILF
jgi:hypothetical protein